MSTPTRDGSRPSSDDTTEDEREQFEGEVVEIERPSSGISLTRIAVSLVAVLAIVGAIYLLESSRPTGTSATRWLRTESSSASRTATPASAADRPWRSAMQ